MIIRARLLVPMAGAPIDDGAVVISEGRIRHVGAWKKLRQDAGQVVDLGEAILMPGLVNAHCHLDYTSMAGLVQSTGKFPDWIKGLLALKAHWSFTEYAQSWLTGAQMLLRTGTTTVLDIEAVPELLPDVLDATPVRVCSFLEMTGVRNRRPAAELIQEVLEKIEQTQTSNRWPGLSPHAPYSTVPELLRQTASVARQRGLRMTMHLSESIDEFEMFASATGALFEWLKGQRPMDDCGLGSPVRHLGRHGMLGPDLLAVHVNYLANGDEELLASNGVGVVHCPRSHSFFGHGPFPVDRLRRSGVTLALGTDSLASVSRTRGKPFELNMFLEMREFASKQSQFAPETIVGMATINGAFVLGRKGQIGEISEGAFADLVALPFVPGHDVYERILAHEGPVLASMIAGQWALPPSNLIHQPNAS